MTIINMTPHSIVVDGMSKITYKPSGNVLRIGYESEELYTINGNIVERNVLSGHNLPDPQDGVMLLVSAMILSTFPDRDDLLAPNTNKATRNENGHIISVPGFVAN